MKTKKKGSWMSFKYTFFLQVLCSKEEEDRLFFFLSEYVICDEIL